MKIFALETNVQKIKDRFLAHGEREIFTASPHFFRFVSAVFGHMLLLIVFLVAATTVSVSGLMQPFSAWMTFAVLFAIFILPAVIHGYIDWKFDFMFLTTDKLIIVDQVSIFKKSITPINLENLGDVVAQTQWLNLFPFGIIHFALKEGQGPEIILKFIPEADKLVAKISQQITLYQRRKDYVVNYRPHDMS